MRKVSGVLLILAGLVIGVLGSSPVFFAAAAYVYRPVLLVLIAAAFVVLVTAVTAWAGFRVARAARPESKALTVSAVAGAVFLAAAYVALLRPPDKPAPMPRPGPEVQYWQLRTESRIAYVKAPAAGTPKPTPVIMLHGGPGGPMLPFVLNLTGHAPLESLSRLGYDVYYYDQLGCGYSSRLDLRREPPYTVGRSVEDLDAIRVAIGAEKMILVGWSYGAVLAAHYMLKHPTRVEKAVFEAPGPLVPGREENFVPPPPIKPADADRWARAIRPTVRLAVGQQLDSLHSRAAFFLVPDWEADQWWERQFAESLLLRQAWVSCNEADGAKVVARLRVPGGSGIGFFSFNFLNEDLIRLGDVRPRLRGNTAPVLVVYPQCDILTWASALEYRKILPNSRLVPIAGAGHMFWYGERQVHDSVIEAFLTGAPPPIEDHPTETPPWTDRP